MIDPKFLVNLKGKTFILLGGLRELGEQKGLVDIRTEPVLELCVPGERFFVFCATGRFRDAEGGESVWVAYGDASPTSSQMKGAELRHAETRAVARMLRFATNCATTAFEELGPDVEDTRQVPQPQDQATRRPAPGGPDPAFQQDYARERAERQEITPQEEERRRHTDPLNRCVTCTTNGCGAVLSPKETEGSRRRWPDQGEVCLVHAMARRLTEQQEAGAARIGAAA